MIPRFLLIVSILSICAFAQHNDSSERTLTAGEYDVYAAVLDFFVAKDIAQHPLVANRTSTFECGSPHNGMSMGGCNGLQGSGETPQQRMQIVQRDLPELEASTVADFESKNAKTAWIDAKIPTKHKYLMFGLAHSDPMPPGWEHPDFVYFSQVGFNPTHTQALVHVSFMSGTNATNSGGKYVLFRKTNDRWERQGSSAVWELVPPQSAQLR
jgi:hypothetical protein